ncbi:MAG TPA: class I SAM-dependent methyltransferase [Nitrososphaerales archaeon]|nr:class I SAM-dependent methyltransferase [Nitrososphaerales archaeon]
MSEPLAIPDYEKYDYTREWRNKQIEDLAEKKILSKWITPGKICLELGGGFGRLTSFLEPRFSQIVMVDFSRANIERASQKLKKTEIIRSELHRLPFEDNKFDYIFLIRVIHHLADPLVVLGEIQRVAKEGATVVISAQNPTIGRYRHLKTNTLVAIGDCGHQIYLAPLNYYSTKNLKETTRLGTGMFENFVGLKLHRLTFLHSVDVMFAPLWYLKPNIFMRLVVTKRRD